MSLYWDRRKKSNRDRHLCDDLSFKAPGNAPPQLHFESKVAGDGACPILHSGRPPGLVAVSNTDAEKTLPGQKRCLSQNAPLECRANHDPPLSAAVNSLRTPFCS